MGQTWKREDDIDPFDQTAVRAHLLDIEREFNKRREQLYYKTQSYFHQSISSNYIKADDLRKMIDECEKLKTEYVDYKHYIADIRGTKYVI